MTAHDTVSIADETERGRRAAPSTGLAELTMAANASTAAKIRALRIVRNTAPGATYEINDDGARFEVPENDLLQVRDRLAEAGLINVTTPPAVPRMAALDWLVTCALVVLAFTVRLNGLGPSSLWLDDAWVGLSARLPWSAIQEVGLTSIGFASMVKIVGSIFGPSALAFQALPVLFGIATPALVVVLLRRWIGIWPAASVALMTALSPIAITFSTRVKQYSFDAFCTVGLLALALHLLEKPEDRRRWARFIVASMLAAVGSSILLVVVAACCTTLGAVVLVRRRRALREAALWASVLGAFTLLYWEFVLGENVNPSVRRYWAARYVQTDEGIGGFLGNVKENVDFAFEAAVPLPSPGWAWILFGLAFVTLAIRRWHIALLCILPLVITVILSILELAPLGGGRTDTHLMTALFVLTGFALNEWASMAANAFRAPRSAVAAGLSLLIMAPTLASISVSLPYPEQDIRTMVQELETERGDDDHVLLYYASVWAYAIYADVDIELVESDPNLRLSLYNVGFDDELTILGNRRGEPEQYQEFVAQSVAGGQRVWFISSHSRQADLEAVATAFINEGYMLDRSSASTGAELSLWVPASS